MLTLKRLQIQGFKSFCDRTELKFHGDGVAAIIGPNGCGKSNIADAISWVLGEQSAKTLRGSRMEDVIFAGTRDRKPTGMAEVSLTLIDPEVYDGADAHEPNRRQQATRSQGHQLHLRNAGESIPCARLESPRFVGAKAKVGPTPSSWLSCKPGGRPRRASQEPRAIEVLVEGGRSKEAHHGSQRRRRPGGTRCVQSRV